MKTEFYRRPKAAFFSYSSQDGALADTLVGWLEGCAGLDVWRDRKDLAAALPVASALERAVRSCRAYILLLSPRSLPSRWVALEHEAAHQQAAEHAAFKRIVLVTADTPAASIPSVLDGITRIHLPGNELDGATAAKLLTSLRGDAGPAFSEDDVFITRSWRAGEPASQFADQVCSWLVDRAGFRLVGDDPGFKAYDKSRVQEIVASCNAYVALVPPREPDSLSWLLADLQVALECQLPVIVLADPKVLDLESRGQLRAPDGSELRFAQARRVLPVDMSGGAPPAALLPDLDELLQDAGRSGATRRSGYTVFYASQPQALGAAEREDIARVVRGITGRRCVFADDISGDAVDEQLLDAIRRAVATVADVSAGALDAWVFAGAARGARRPVSVMAAEGEAPVPTLMAGFKPRRYRSHAERVGLVHAAVYEHRRLFLNQEVLRW